MFHRLPFLVIIVILDKDLNMITASPTFALLEIPLHIGVKELKLTSLWPFSCLRACTLFKIVMSEFRGRTKPNDYLVVALLPAFVWLIILPAAKLVAFVFLASSITDFNVVLSDPGWVALLSPGWVALPPV